jgi:hypothetical protein
VLISKVGIEAFIVHTQYRLGQSFWVGEVSDIANHSLRDVDTHQQGVIGLAEYVKGIEC